MTDLDLDDELGTFSQLSDQILKQLNCAIDLVGKGIAPTVDDVRCLGIDMGQLRESYDRIRSYASEAMGSDRLPADDLPTNQYVALAKAAVARERVAEVVSLLDRFCQITSDIPKLVDALRPFQDEAAKSATALRGEDARLTPDDLDKISQPKKLLVNAIDADNIAPEAKLALLERLGSAYSQDVVYGVATHLYYFGEKAVPSAEQPEPVEKAAPVAEKQKPKPVATSAPAEAKFDTSKPVEEPASAESKQASVQSASARTTPGTLRALEYKRRGGSVTASAVKADLAREGRGLAFAFPAIAKYGAITRTQLNHLAELLATSSDDSVPLITQPQLSRGLSSLVENGVASTFVLDGQLVYCLTSFGRRQASNEKVYDLGLTPGRKARGVKCNLQTASTWLVFITSNRMRADSTVSEPKLRAAVDLTQLALDYMDALWDRLSVAQRHHLFHNVRCDDGVLHAPALVHGKLSQKPRFRIVRSAADVPEGETDVVVLDQLDVQDGRDQQSERNRPVRDQQPQDAQVDESDEILLAKKDKSDEKPARPATAEESTEPESGSDSTPTDDAPIGEPASEPAPTQAPESSAAESKMIHESELEPEPQPAPVEAELQSAPASESGPVSAAPVLDDDSPAGRAARYVAGQGVPTDNELATLAWDMVRSIDLSDPRNAGHASFSPVATALTMLKSASQIDGYRACRQLFDALVAATDSAIAPHEYTGAYLSSRLDLGKVDASLVLSAYLRAMLAPSGGYEDWTLYNTCKTYFDAYDQWFDGYGLYKQLFNDLRGVWDCSRVEGFSDAVMDRLTDDAAMRSHLLQMTDEAHAMLVTPKFKTIMSGLPEFAQMCFGRGSDLEQCMQIIARNDVGEKELVRGVLRDFSKQDAETWQIDQDVIDQLIDDNWHEASSGKTTGRLRKLGLLARKQANEYFAARLNLMHKWVSYDDSQIDEAALGELRKQRSKILSDIDEVLGSGADFSGQSVLVLCLLGIKARLTSGAAHLTFTDLLRSGYLSLDAAGFPVVDPRLNDVRHAEPWRDALRHYCDWHAGKLPTLAQAGERIVASDTLTSDNLGQLRSIVALVATAGEPVPERLNEALTPSVVADAQDRADLAGDEFGDYLEIAYAYGRIDEAQKETLSEWASSLREIFYQRDDYGCWRRLLHALRQQVDDDSREQGAQLASELRLRRASLKAGKASSLLDEADKLLAEEQNFAVVEEYINRFDLGERDVVGDLGRNWRDDNDFETFISKDVFDPLYNYCFKHRNVVFRKFAANYVRNNCPDDWTNHYRESAENLVRSWPIRNVKNPPLDEVNQLMRELGFESRGCNQPVDGVEHFVVDVKPEPTGRTSYAHPIKDFGTKMGDKLDVIVLRGSLKASTIIQKLNSYKTSRIPVVLLDSPLNLGERRQLAQLLHSQRSQLTQFLLVDHVLALHLALHVREERLPLLLKCTLPFTYYQPFVRDGGATSDEMFFGREAELASILDPDGACVVYGGRQLGKTALLERAANLANKPRSDQYAVYVSILSCDTEEAMARRVSSAIAKGVGVDFGQQTTVQSLADRIRELMETGAVKRLLLLMDESDRFLSSISTDAYEQMQPLVDLKRSTKNDFKFVLAGLHNVSRAQKATANNGIFGQLGEPLCVMPLSPNDALSLISRPLGYLGFQVAKYPHLETILTNTNYYPGIIQFFGYELVNTMASQYGVYYDANRNNPPYTLEKKQLGTILNRTDMNNSIKEKFRLSLELDPRYLMIARCVAVLYFQSRDDGDTIRNQEGYSAREIMELAEDWGLKSFAAETERSMDNLLDEMVDMGILFRTDNDRKRYRMRRRTFINIIGKSENEILEDMLQADLQLQGERDEKGAGE